MRNRLIKPEFFRDEDLGRVNFAAKLLFAGLWCASDRCGRLRDRPRVILADVFPTHDDVTANDVDGWLDELASIGVIERYEVDGKRYVQVKNFSKHQKIHPKEASSTIPPPRTVNTQGEPKVDPRFTQGEPKARLCREIPPSGIPSSTSTSTSTSLSLTRESRQRAAARRRSALSGEGSLGFERFWSAYPNRTHRLEAEKAWRALDPPPELVDQVVAAIDVWKRHRQWADRQFVPHPATWLRRRLWEDEFVTSGGTSHSSQPQATGIDSLRRQHDYWRRRAAGGDEQARLTLAEFERDHADRLGLDQPAAIAVAAEVAP